MFVFQCFFNGRDDVKMTLKLDFVYKMTPTLTIQLKPGENSSNDRWGLKRIERPKRETAVLHISAHAGTHPRACACVCVCGERNHKCCADGFLSFSPHLPLSLSLSHTLCSLALADSGEYVFHKLPVFYEEQAIEWGWIFNGALGKMLENLEQCFSTLSWNCPCISGLHAVILIL